MNKLLDMVAIVRASMEKTKEVVGWLVAMGRDLGGMVGELKSLLPKKQVEEPSEVDEEAGGENDNEETPPEV